MNRRAFFRRAGGVAMVPVAAVVAAAVPPVPMDTAELATVGLEGALEAIRSLAKVEATYRAMQSAELAVITEWRDPNVQEWVPLVELHSVSGSVWR